VRRNPSVGRPGMTDFVALNVEEELL